MNEQNKFRTLWVMVISLTFLNLIMMGWIWFNAGPLGPMNPIPPEKMVEMLHFDQNQRGAFHKLKERHFHEIEPIRDSIRLLIDQNYDLIKTDNLDENLLYTKSEELARVIIRNEENTRRHLFEVRKLCNSTQKEIFDHEVLDLFKKQREDPKGRRPRAPKN